MPTEAIPPCRLRPPPLPPQPPPPCSPHPFPRSSPLQPGTTHTRMRCKHLAGFLQPPPLPAFVCAGPCPPPSVSWRRHCRDTRRRRRGALYIRGDVVRAVRLWESQIFRVWCVDSKQLCENTESCQICTLDSAFAHYGLFRPRVFARELHWERL